MKFTACLFAFVALFLCLPLTLLGQDEKAKRVDPSGTWRWEHEDPGSGETVNDVLRINLAKEGKVVGTYQGRDKPIEIQRGEIKGDRLTFEFDLERDQTIKISFDGKIEKDEVNGEVSFAAAGNSGSFPWSAKRSVELNDLIGVWVFKIETPDGNTLTPIMTVAKPKDAKSKLGVTWKTGSGQDMKVKELKIKNNHALFSITGEFDGSDIAVDFKGRPYGDKMAGSLEYDVAGNIGEGEFSCQRTPAKK